MRLTKGQYYILFLAIITFLLLRLTFNWIDYLFANNYIKESFQQMYNPNINNSSQETSHSVDLPLTTTYSCQNFCGPTSRCAITGQQCFTDIDCPGCQPYTPPLSDSEKKMDEVIGDNDAGILTFNNTPRYSVLTTDMGTKAKSFPSKKFAKAPFADYGIDVWRKDFDEQEKLFDKRYKPGKLEYMPEYPKRYSLTGEFIEEGPIAANATLS
jgi:hypothetical protein